MSLPVVLATLLYFFLDDSNAQTTVPVAQCYISPDETATRWIWMNNSKGQSPCAVASFLQIPCAGEENSALPGLVNSADQYTGVGGQNACLCNTVLYSLIEACQLCQYYVPGNEVSWSAYSFNCTNITNGSYPLDVPSGTAIPAWAYQDVSHTEIFDLTVAQEVAAQGLPDTTASHLSTSPTSSDTATTTTATTLSSHSSSATSTASASNNVGAIVGGLVGGVFGILVFGMIVFLLLRQRKLQRRRQAQVEASERPTSTATAASGHQPSLTPMSLISKPSMIYDPNDPRTFPPAFQTPPSPSIMRAASSAPNGPPASCGGYMLHSFGTMQNHSASSFYGGDHGHSYAASTYKGAPEV